MREDDADEPREAGRGHSPVPDHADPDPLLPDVQGVPHGRRLTRREKSVRLLGTVALVAVVVVAIAGGPAALPRIWATLVGTGQQSTTNTPPLLSVPAPITGSVPQDAVTVPSVQITPLSGGGSSAIACWINPRLNYQDASGVTVTGGPVHLALTRDNGGLWQTLASPAGHGSSCTIVADQAVPLGALAVVVPPAPLAGGCPLSLLYRTTDAGASWQRLSWPDTALPLCGMGFALVDGEIYVGASQPIVLSPGVAGTAGRILHTTDGAAWQAVDAEIPLSGTVALAGARIGGNLLVSVANPTSTVVLRSTNRGATWQTLGTLAAGNATVFAASQATTGSPSSWGPLYGVVRPTPKSTPNASPTSAQPPTAANQLILYESARGASWSRLPALPTEQGTLPMTELANMVGVGARGGLIVLRQIDNGAFHIFTETRQLWRWDVAGGRWLLDPYYMPPDSYVSGSIAAGGTFTVWLVIVHGGITPTVSLLVDAIT